MKLDETIDIQGKICRQFNFIIWTSYIDQFVNPLGGEGMG